MMAETSIMLPGICWPILAIFASSLGLIIVRCMFCGGFLGIKCARGAPGGISHGLGAECVRKFK